MNGKCEIRGEKSGRMVVNGSLNACSKPLYLKRQDKAAHKMIDTDGSH